MGTVAFIRRQPSVPDGGRYPESYSREDRNLSLPALLWDDGLRVSGGLVTHVFGGGQSLESGVRWRFVTVISHRTGPGGPVDCNHSPGLRYDYGKRQLLLHPRQGHFQGLSKAWEGAGGETPTVPQCL